MALALMVPTKAQRVTIKILRAQLAELGYCIVPVARRFRRSPLDTIAVPKDVVSASVFAFIRPERNGSICVRPYCRSSLYGKLHTRVQKWRNNWLAPVYWNDKPLTFMPEKHLPWYMRISKEGRNELRQQRIVAF